MKNSSVDFWAWSISTEISGQHSELLAPQTNLVGECGHTMATKPNNTKWKPWHWDSVQQTALNILKTAITNDVILVYPDYW